MTLKALQLKMHLKWIAIMVFFQLAYFSWSTSTVTKIEHDLIFEYPLRHLFQQVRFIQGSAPSLLVFYVVFLNLSFR